MDCLEILLELIKLRPQFLPLILDAGEGLLGIIDCMNGELALQFLQLRFLLGAESGQVVSSEA